MKQGSRSIYNSWSLVAIEFVREILETHDEPVCLLPHSVPHLVASEADEGILQQQLIRKGVTCSEGRTDSPQEEQLLSPLHHHPP